MHHAAPLHRASLCTMHHPHAPPCATRLPLAPLHTMRRTHAPCPTPTHRYAPHTHPRTTYHRTHHPLTSHRTPHTPSQLACPTARLSNTIPPLHITHHSHSCARIPHTHTHARSYHPNRPASCVPLASNPPNQLNKQVNSLASRGPSTDHGKPQSRSRSGRYQPYNTDIGANAAGQTNDESPRSSRPVSTSKRNKVGSHNSGNDHPPNGGTDPRGLSACAICLGRNPHDVSQCTASLLWDNHTPAFTKKGDKGAKLRVASSGDTLCLDWNLPRSCSSSSHLARHRCSGCGNDDHGAQSCRLAQPKV